jgi:hypothetical protein
MDAAYRLDAPLIGERSDAVLPDGYARGMTT